MSIFSCLQGHAWSALRTTTKPNGRRDSYRVWARRIIFHDRIFSLVTAFSFIQSRHQLFQVFLGECKGWHWQDNTPLYGSVGIRQDDAVTSPADRFSLSEADRVFKGVPCPFAWTSLRARGARTEKPSALKSMGKRACASALWIARRRLKRS